MPGNLTAESFLIALSGLVIVFLMLAVLSLLIVAVSRAVGAVAGKVAPAAASSAPRPSVAPAAPAVMPAPAPVRLEGVNELTAACIMAIISDELGTTPDRLAFKSIRAL